MSASAWRLRLLYFLYYGSVGALLPYLAPYLRGLGFSGGSIGAVLMLAPATAPVVALGWATWADRRGAPEVALRRATLVAACGALLLPLAGVPAAVGGALLLQAAGASAVVPLLDALTLDHVRRHPGASYGPIRLAGSVGFLVLSLGLGALLAARQDRPADPVVPLAVAALVTAYALAARRLPPVVASGGDRPGWRDLRAVAASRPLQLFLAGCALHWLACAPYHLLFGLFVRDAGLPSSVTGAGMAVGIVAEVAVLLWFPRLGARWSDRALFGAVAAASMVRWALLARAATVPEVVGLQALHGLTFGLFWATAVRSMGGLVPERLRATGQALFSAVVFGGGNSLGYALAGAGYDRLGGAGPVFGAAAVVEGGLLVALVAGWGRSPPRPAAC